MCLVSDHIRTINFCNAKNVFAMISDDAIHGIPCHGLFTERLFSPARDKEGLGDATGLVSRPDANLARSMDIISCMPFSSTTNLLLLTFTIVKGPNVFCICLLYVVVVIRSVSLTVEAAKGRLLMYTSCPG